MLSCFKTIAEVSPVLLSFIDELDLPLSRPQKRHIAQVADALITTEGSKTLSALYSSIVGDPCPKSAADTFREAPWTAADLRAPLRAHLAGLVFKMAAAMGLTKHVFLSVAARRTAPPTKTSTPNVCRWWTGSSTWGVPYQASRCSAKVRSTSCCLSPLVR